MGLPARRGKEFALQALNSYAFVRSAGERAEGLKMQTNENTQKIVRRKPSVPWQVRQKRERRQKKARR